MDKSRYHFVFDRLRAVRQDLVVQSVRNEVTLKVLEISVRFHLYAGYKYDDSCAVEETLLYF